MLFRSGIMSLLAANLRRRTAQRAPVLIARRNLGENVRGPGATSLSFGANAHYAKAYFTEGAVSYAVYKQQLQSLRLFVFTGVTLGCVLGLALDPPKSSYWATFSPGYWLGNARGGIFPAKTSIFMTDKVERETDVKEIHENLVAWRRLPGTGEDDE